MKKVFMSVAVKGLTPEQTKAKHQEYFMKIHKIIGEFEDVSINNPKNEPFTGITEEKPALYWWSNVTVKELTEAEVVVFCGDISNTRGCRVEKLICELFEIPHIVIA